MVQGELTEFEIAIPSELPAGSTTFGVTNVGTIEHSFSGDNLGIDVDIAPGAEQTTTINAPAGTYEDDCDVLGHREGGMVGTMTVERS